MQGALSKRETTMRSMGAHEASQLATLDTYSHAIPALQEEAAERIAGLVLAGG